MVQENQPKLGAGAAAGDRIRMAISLHQQGRLGEAAQFYDAVLKDNQADFDCLHSYGLLRAQQARFNEAAELIGAAVEQNPLSVEALVNLGNVLAILNRQEGAAATYQRALVLKPDYADAHNNLGIALHALGRNEDAIVHYRKALSINSRFGKAYNNLGSVLETLHRSAEAIEYYEKALAISPNDPEVHNNLGVSLVTLSRREEAIKHYRKALAIKPSYAEAHNNLGAALEALNRPDEAIASCERAIVLRPNFPEAHNNLGNALRKANRYTEAFACYQKAIAGKPDFALAHGNMGDVLREFGRAQEAQRAYQTAVELAPQWPRYYRRLADTKRFSEHDPHFVALLKLAQDKASLSQDEQVELQFTLAKIFGDLGHNDQSFQHLLEGNSLQRQRIAYDEAATLGFFDRIRAVFRRELMAPKEGLGAQSNAPLFIVGMIRSGTTLVEQMLASHPKAYGAGELTTLGKIAARLGGIEGGAATFPEIMTNMTGSQLKQYGEEYVTEVSRLAPSAERIIDKMPANFRLVGLIHLLLPNARLIHVQRDPVDTCLSCFSILFAGDQPFAYELGELGRYYRAYETLMEHWRGVLPRDVMLEIRYEELVADTERQARKMLAHAGLEWDDRCLAFHETQRPIRTASALQVRRPVYRSSIGRPKPSRDLLNSLLKGLNIA